METVSQLIGVPVHYYVQVDFGTFVSFINLIGGIDVYIEKRMVLDPIGSGQDHFVLAPGDIRHLTGIHTNLTLDDAVKLAALVKDIPLEGIRQGAIDNNMAVFANTTLDGVPASVLRPVPGLIRVLRDEIFTADGPASPLAQGDPITLMQTEGARVRVTNNTYTGDLDIRTGNFLKLQGMQVMEYGYPTGWSDQTVLVIYSPKLYTLRYLEDLFGIKNSYYIIMETDSSETVDIEIRIGEDWVSRLPIGY